MLWQTTVYCLLTTVLLVGCGPASARYRPDAIGLTAVDQVYLDPVARDINRRDLIEIPISVYIFDDTQVTFNSSRSAEEIAELHNQANEIWSQADIRFTFNKVIRATVPIAMTANIIRWEVDEFFVAQAQLERNLHPTTPISGYFVQTVRGPNGIASVEHLAYFVSDDPINDDARVVAHELGHLLGLVHVNDPSRLMHSGTDGTKLTAEEIALARQTAENFKK